MCNCSKSKTTLSTAQGTSARWRVQFAGGNVKPYLTETEARTAHSMSPGSTLLAPS